MIYLPVYIYWVANPTASGKVYGYDLFMRVGAMKPVMLGGIVHAPTLRMGPSFRGYKWFVELGCGAVAKGMPTAREAADVLLEHWGIRPPDVDPPIPRRAEGVGAKE